MLVLPEPHLPPTTFRPARQVSLKLTSTRTLAQKLGLCLFELLSKACDRCSSHLGPISASPGLVATTFTAQGLGPDPEGLHLAVDRFKEGLPLPCRVQPQLLPTRFSFRGGNFLFSEPMEQ